MAGVLSFLLGTRLGRVFVLALCLLLLAIAARNQIRRNVLEEVEQESLQETAKAEQQRKVDDAYLQGLEDYRLCLEYFGDGGVRGDAPCEQLRGVHKEQP